MPANRLLARLVRPLMRGAKPLLLASALAIPSHSWAYAECQLTPLHVYVDSTTVWITWTTGQSNYAALSDPAAKLYYAAALTALTTGHQLTVRMADGITCPTIAPNGTPMIGLWIV